ncbi:Uncharacterised protein [uncultured archaeon]|nr:Uncharacterised protein [uncultured archaeon]
MGKKCEICGRSIKTGRKYCWEHRNSSQNNGINTIKNIEMTYLKHRRKTIKLNKTLLYLGNGIMILGLLLSVIFQNWFLVSIGLILGFILLYIERIIAENKIHKEINNRSEEFVKFAKECGNEIKSEREFRKSIFQ